MLGMRRLPVAVISLSKAELVNPYAFDIPQFKTILIFPRQKLFTSSTCSSNDLLHWLNFIVAFQNRVPFTSEQFVFHVSTSEITFCQV